MAGLDYESAMQSPAANRAMCPVQGVPSSVLEHLVRVILDHHIIGTLTTIRDADQLDVPPESIRAVKIASQLLQTTSFLSFSRDGMGYQVLIDLIKVT